MYNPFDWYWLADDGRVFASKRQVIVTDADAEYQAWLTAGNHPSDWPRDLAGEQTDAALQDVLRPYNIFVNLAYYTAHARQKRIESDITVNGLPFSTDPLTYGSLNSAFIYTQAKTASTFSWKLPDGSFITLDKTDIAALHDASNRFAQDCYKCEDTTLDGIEAGTITDRAAIDAAFAAIPNTFTGLSEDAQKVRHGPRKAKKRG
jgi:hypothetical protein